MVALQRVPGRWRLHPARKPLRFGRSVEAARLRAMASYMTRPGRDAVQPLLAATAQLRDLGSAAARATCLSALGAAMWTGRVDPDGLRRTVEAARAAAGPFLRHVLDTYATGGVPGALWLAVATAVELGDLRTVLGITDRAATLARATGTLSIIPTALTYRMIALIHAGRFAETRDLIVEAAAAEEAIGLKASMIAPAMLDAYRGRERSAVRLIEALERDGEQRGLGWLLGVAKCSRAVLHNGLGNYPLALEAAREALEYQDFALHHWALTELVEAAARTGDQAAAAEARERLSDWARAGTPWARGVYALAEALAGTPASADQTSLVESRYREAIDHFDRGGLGVLQARSRLLFGEWLRRQNRRAQARTELRAAYEAAATTGMEAFGERARRELLATGETVRRRTEGAVVLTPQETQIGRLVAAGHSNAEVGAQLFLSPRTVEWHLRKIFAKLGISSRRELDGALLAR
jgi:DNA-binding CsgD family transcriptional regulator/tetratricopeptide (TPR) repeat protein